MNIPKFSGTYFWQDKSVEDDVIELAGEEDFSANHIGSHEDHFYFAVPNADDKDFKRYVLDDLEETPILYSPMNPFDNGNTTIAEIFKMAEDYDA